jgi:hypothetical protein
MNGVAGLEFFAEELEGGVADEGGEEGDGEVGVGEDVGEGGGEGLALAGRAIEFAHEEVGVEEEDDEGDLDDGAEQGGEEAARFGIAGHGVMVQNAAVEGRHAPGVKPLMRGGLRGPRLKPWGTQKQRRDCIGRESCCCGDGWEGC